MAEKRMTEGGRPARDPDVAKTAMRLILTMLFFVPLIQTAVVTALPEMTSDLGGFDRYVWVLSGFLVALSLALPIAGGLGDVLGRKGFLVGGMWALAVTTILVGLSQTMDQAIALRVAQGLAAGVIAASAVAAVADLFPAEDRGKKMGTAIAVLALASLVGPMLGGVITDLLTWRAVFLVPAPFMLPVAWQLHRRFPATPVVENAKVDYLGIAVLTIGGVALMMGMSLGGVAHPWLSATSLLLFGGGLAMAVVFVVVERRASHPIMPLSIYEAPGMATGLGLAFLTGVALYSLMVFLPLLFRADYGADATMSGMMLLPVLVGVVVGSAAAGKLFPRSNADCRRHILACAVVLGAAMYLVWRADASTGTAWLSAYLLALGVSLGGALTFVAVALQLIVPHRSVGAASSANLFFRHFGGMAGLAIAGTVFSTGFATRVDDIALDHGTSAPASVFETVKQNPEAILETGAGGSMTLADGAELSVDEELLGSTRLALIEALDQALFVLLVAALLAVVLSPFFRPVRHAGADASLVP